MITITTLKIMTPHIRELSTVQKLLDHLTAIDYLEFENGHGYVAAPDVRLECLADDEYLLSQNGRAHNIRFTKHGQLAFEQAMLIAGTKIHVPSFNRKDN